MTVTAYSWNVNGLRAVHRKGNFLEWMLPTDPDIVCIQEIKALVEQLPPELREVAGYHPYFNPAVRKGYSGVALYTKTEPDHVEYGLGIDEFDQEGRVIVAHYPKFVLMNIYFPNGRMSPERLAFKMAFYDAFLQYADRIVASGKNLIVCGDVNTAHREIDLARPGPNATVSGFLPEERAWMDEWFKHGYVDTLRLFNDEPGQYSYWDQRFDSRSRNVGWRIDYFVVNQSLAPRVSNGWISAEVFGSDHCPIGIELDF